MESDQEPDEMDHDAHPIVSTSVSQSQSPLPDQEFEEYISKYPFAAEPTYFTRPNRYYGPASTWRSWTQSARADAKALDDSRARDLSIHLYNAFALKQKLRQATDADPSQASRSRSRGRARSETQNRDSDNLFAPPDVWTAWPLPASDVPRDDSHSHADHERTPKVRDMCPSSSLEDALIATTLRDAKDRWCAREQEPKVLENTNSKRDWKAEYELTKQQLRDSGLLDDEDQKPKKKANDETEDIQESSEPDNNNMPLLPNHEPSPGIQTFSSQMYAVADTSSEAESSVSSRVSVDQEPVFMADDEEARHILLPATRHVLSKLDDLLIGLHTARQAYAHTDRTSRSQSRSRSTKSHTEATDDERFIRTGSRAASRSKGRKRKRLHSSQNELLVIQEDRSQSRGRSTSGRSVKRERVLALRDWSDVLGVAALTGWKTETIARASERCAKLFDQNMMFRTFHESDTLNTNHVDNWSTFVEEYAYVPAESIANEKELEDEEHATQSRHKKYTRTSSACRQCHQRKSQCQPPDNIESFDDSTPVTCTSCTSTQNQASPCSGIYIKPSIHPNMPSQGPKTCPYPTCPRNTPDKPFAKTYHLQRHLESVHGHRYSPPQTPPSTSQTLPSRPKPTHETPLICPVPNCPQAGHRYGRSARLYDHIRHAHPEFDLETYQKMSAKGKRGKYDRSKRGLTRRKNEQMDGAGGSGSETESGLGSVASDEIHEDGDWDGDGDEGLN